MYDLILEYSDDTPFWYSFDFNYGTYKSEQQAKDAEIDSGKSKKVYLDRLNSCITIYDKNTKEVQEIYENIAVKRLKDEVIQRIGEPLPISDPKTKDIAINAIKNQNPKYCVYPNDYSVVDDDLSKIIEHIYTIRPEQFIEKRFYALQSIAYLINKKET